MNKLTITGFALSALLATEAGLAHGGQYRGPADVVPPNTGGGGPSTGGPGTPGPITPGPTAPGAPAPAGPTTPGPGAPPPPNTGGGGAPAPGGGPATGPRGIDLSADLSQWQFWWEFNKDPFINLREAIHAPETTTGSDEFFMGASKKVASKDTAKPSESDIQEHILPALKKALDTTDDRDINSSCMVALAKIGQDPARETWRIMTIFEENLKKPDQEIRETAALAMGISGQPKSVEKLTELARDTAKGRELCGRSEVDVRTRAFALYGLGLVAYANSDVDLKRQAFEPMKAVLEDPAADDRNLRVAAINAISLLKVQIENQSEKDQKLLQDALGTLDAYYKKEEGRGTDLMKSHVGPAIAKLIGRGNSTAFHKTYKNIFLEELGKPKRGNDIYRGAALTLGRLAQATEVNKDDEKYSKGLVSYFETGKDAQARYFALLALGQIGGNSNKTELMKVLAKGNKALERPWAAISLGVYAFEKFASEKDATVETALGEQIRQELQDVKNPEARGAFAVALGLARYTDAASDIMNLLMKLKAQDEVAGYLCIGLALMNYQKAKTDIHDIVKASVRRPELLSQAAIALGKLGDKTVTTTLTAMLTEGEPNLAKFSAIASALGYIGDRRTIQPLKAMLFNDQLTPLSRAFAAVALGGVADKETLPWNSKISRDLNYRAAVETLTTSGSGVLDIL